MRFVAGFVAVAVAAVLCSAAPVGTMNLVRSVNQKTKLWTASLSSPVAHLSHDEVRALLGAGPEGFTHPSKFFDRHTYSDRQRLAAPESYDPRDHYNCTSMKTVPDQSACGSCWAVGSAAAMSDRACMAEHDDDLILSAADVLACSGGGGCNGGQPSDAFIYWNEDGVVDAECKPYPFPSCDHHVPGSKNPCPSEDYPTPSCSRKCENGEKWKKQKHFAKDVYYVQGHDDIVTELAMNGPCEASFAVYEDFLVYTSGVYHHVSGDLVGYHAVKLLGYGVENGTKYWLLVNNWNEHWGEKGLFRMVRGNNECEIESEVIAGVGEKPKSH